MSQGPQKPDHRGNFIMLPARLMASVAWRHLTLRARNVLLIIQSRHSGFNNGKIGIGIREISAAIGDQNHGANAKAVAELIEKGFVECTSTADRHQSKVKGARVPDHVHLDRRGKTRSAGHSRLRPLAAAAWREEEIRCCETATPTPVSVVETATPVQISVVETATQATANREVLQPGCVAGIAAHIGNHLSGESCTPGQGAIVLPIKKPADPESIGVPLDELRSWMKAVIVKLGYGGQHQLATSAGVPDSSLSRFRNGRSLPAHFRIPLQTACGRILPYRKWADNRAAALASIDAAERAAAAEPRPR